MTDYNWSLNAENLAADWYFESYPEQARVPGEEADTFVSDSRAANAEPMLTVPLLGWVANLGANRTILPSFSVAKYGPQCATDPYFSDAGDGIETDCSTFITGNDPYDSYVKDSPALEQKWIKHLVKTWGKSARVESNIISWTTRRASGFRRIVTRIPKARTRSNIATKFLPNRRRSNRSTRTRLL